MLHQFLLKDAYHDCAYSFKNFMEKYFYNWLFTYHPFVYKISSLNSCFNGKCRILDIHALHYLCRYHAKRNNVLISSIITPEHSEIARGATFLVNYINRNLPSYMEPQLVMKL